MHRAQGRGMTEVAVTASCPTPYRRRRPERTLLYRTVQTHFATWLALRRAMGSLTATQCRPTSSASSAAISTAASSLTASPAPAVGNADTTS